MTDSEIVQAFVDVHSEIQSDLGHDPGDVGPQSCPLRSLSGFDSQLIPNAVRMVALRLGTKLPKGVKVKNIYVSPDGQKKFTIEEIAERFGALVGQEAAAA